MRTEKTKRTILAVFVIVTFFSLNSRGLGIKTPKPLPLGYSVGIDNITPEKMSYAKSVGIDYIEVSTKGLIGNERSFRLSDDEIRERMKKIRQATEAAGIKIWSVHMPYGRDIDLSLLNEAERKQVVAFHRKLLDFCRILQPKIILFHPSFYLGLNEREARKEQLIKSAIELNETVKKMGATLVIENMLGYELKKDQDRENPLCRTVEETVEIMGRLPETIFSAVDMNHITEPEKLIRALGNRLKSVHVSDGNGKKECHYLPGSEGGQNNWNEILAALNEANYEGPFMFECAYEDVSDFQLCYKKIYSQFIAQKKAGSSLSVSGEEASLKYVKGESLTVSGRPGFIQPGHFNRVDTLDFKALPQGVRNSSPHSSGLNILFKTNSSCIGVKWKLRKYLTRGNMTPTAINGLDLYGWNGRSWQFVSSAAPRQESGDNTAMLVKNLSGEMRQYRIYLPLYAELTGIEVGVTEESAIEPADPEYLPTKKVVIYGSSITQGASASRPGMAYPSIISRKLNIETFNLGFSGAGKMEIEMADVLANLPADLYILDCVPNTSPNQIKERAIPFIRKLRSLRPDIPILMVESIFREGGNWDRQLGIRVRQQNDSFRDAYKQLASEKFQQIYYLPSDKLTGSDHEATIDGTHLTDLGQLRLARQVGHTIANILKLPPH